jgi:dihydrofolate reductase
MTPGGKRVVLVAAVAENGVIGRDGAIPWKLSEDWKHFKAFTSGHTLVMGRTTQEGIGRPLPDRTSIVLTSDESWSMDGVLSARTFEDAMRLADSGLPGDVMVGGGAGVYAAALPHADEQVLSEVHQSPDGDTHYPEFDRTEWDEADRDERDGFTIVRWVRATR